MEVREKFQRLIEHYLEHQSEHKESFLKWAQEAERAGLKEVARHLKNMAEEMEKAKVHLLKAKSSLQEGGEG